MQGPRRRYGWRCNPIGYQPNYTHIPNEKAWNLREAVFLKSVCAALGDHLVGTLCRIVGYSSNWNPNSSIDRSRCPLRNWPAFGCKPKSLPLSLIFLGYEPQPRHQ